MILSGIILDRLVQALGWTLLHSCWQGAVLALLGSAGLLFTRRKQASLQYGLLLILLFVFCATATGTFLFYWNNNAYTTVNTPGVLPATAINPASITQSAPGSFLQPLKQLISGNASLLMFSWFIVCCYRLVKILGSWLYAKRICRLDIYSPPAEWQESFFKLAAQMNIKRKLWLRESEAVSFPVTLGLFKPLVLVPAGMLCALSTVQVELVLRHELAHIKRYDYLVNLWQLIVESVFFFNPGLLWISNQLREKREFSCDDMALGPTGNKEAYLHALIHFKSASIQSLSAAVGLTGQTTQLHKRVTRILGANEKTIRLNRSSLLYALLTGMAFLMALYITGHKHPDETMGAKKAVTALYTVPYQSGPPAVTIPAVLVKQPEKKKVVTESAVTKKEPETVVMDSATLSMLTGEFNTIYEQDHYIIGVAKSRITHLTVNGEPIATDQFYKYDRVFAGIINRFKMSTKGMVQSPDPVIAYPVPPVKKIQAVSG